MIRRTLLAVPIALFAITCGAAEWSGYRNVMDFGCHRSDGTCFVTIDGPAVTGAAGCVSNSIRWDSKNDANGRTWLALIISAKAMGKKVGFSVDGCYAFIPSFPTFSWGVVEP